MKKEIRYVLERQLTTEGAEELNELGRVALEAIKQGKVPVKEGQEAQRERAIEVLSRTYEEGQWVTMGEFKYYKVAKQEKAKRVARNKRNRTFEKLRIVKAEYNPETSQYVVIPW